MSALLLFRKTKPTMDLAFLGSLPSQMTLARASAGWSFNSAGVLTQGATNAARFDSNPSTLLPRGLLIEESRANGIKNNTMVGGVGGSPGTLPTNWSTGGSGLGTLTQTLSYGTEDGIAYIDWRLNGTTSTTTYVLKTCGGTEIAALNGQTWTFACFLKIAAGSMTNITDIRMGMTMRNSGGGGLGDIGVITNSVPTTAKLSTQRFATTATTTSGSTAYLNNFVGFDFPSGVAIDVTLRIGLPQQEQGGFASSPIPTTGTAVTRAADVLSTSLGPWFNAAGGAFATDAMIEAANTAHTAHVACFDDGTAANSIAAFVNTSGYAQGENTISSTPYASANSSAISANQVFKTALSYKAGNNLFALNGAAVGAGSLGASALPTGLTTLHLGDRADGARTINGWLRRFRYWNYTLDATTLNQVTT